MRGIKFLYVQCYTLLLDKFIVSGKVSIVQFRFKFFLRKPAGKLSTFFYICVKRMICIVSIVQFRFEIIGIPSFSLFLKKYIKVKAVELPSYRFHPQSLVFIRSGDQLLETKRRSVLILDMSWFWLWTIFGETFLFSISMQKFREKKNLTTMSTMSWLACHTHAFIPFQLARIRGI